MKKSLIYLLSLFGIISCGVGINVNKNEKQPTAKNLDYASSLSSWLQLKKKHHGSYEYFIEFISYTGYSSTTKIVVQNDEVVSRSFYEVDPTNTSEPKGNQPPKYTEDISTLNTHEEGSPGVTIDSLYRNCSEQYLSADTQENTITFQVDELGIMKVCGYTPKNCMDDCFQGISLGKIRW